MPTASTPLTTPTFTAVHGVDAANLNPFHLFSVLKLLHILIYTVDLFIDNFQMLLSGMSILKNPIIDLDPIYVRSSLHIQVRENKS